MEEWRGEYTERSLWSETGWCARRMRKRTRSQMQVCQRGRASIVLLFGFHSVHSSTEEQKNENTIKLSKQTLC